jgi:dolichol kinase
MYVYKHVREKLLSRLYNNVMLHILAVTMTTYNGNIRYVACAVCLIVYGDGLPDATHFFSCPLGLLW